MMGAGELRESLKEKIAAIQEELCALRHALHRHPEVSGAEYGTAQRIRAELERIGLPWRAIHGTGTCAELQGGFPGPAILLRADIDALPIREESLCPFASENEGVMHACGHDIHTAALLGAARLLVQCRASLHGSVRFVFQQAEESGHGSQYFLGEGVAEGCERIYGFHVAPERPMGVAVLTRGTDAASCDHMRIRLQGKGAHIAKPQYGHDALAAAAEVVLQLRSLAGKWDPMDRCLVGVGRILAGSAWNIIADAAEIEGTVRTLSMASRERLLALVRSTAERVASLHEVSCEVTFELNTPCLVNDARAYETMYAAAEETLGGRENIREEEVPMGFGGDDFAAFSERVPGCLIHLGTALPGVPDSNVPLHSANLLIDDRILGIGCEILLRCALSHLLPHP